MDQERDSFAIRKLGTPHLQAHRQPATLTCHGSTPTIATTVVERARHNNARVIAEATDQPWGERVGVFSDPDGNEIYVGQANTTGQDG